MVWLPDIETGTRPSLMMQRVGQGDGEPPELGSTGKQIVKCVTPAGLNRIGEGHQDGLSKQKCGLEDAWNNTKHQAGWRAECETSPYHAAGEWAYLSGQVASLGGAVSAAPSLPLLHGSCLAREAW
jgi:hypothetical protein